MLAVGARRAGWALWGALAANCALVGCKKATSSAETIKWKLLHPSETQVVMNHACHAKGLYVAVGLQGAIVTSRDGVRWSAATVPPTNPGPEKA